MYGMVNKAVKGLVVDQFGEEAWELIRAKANSPDDFVAMEGYADAMTYSLVGAAAEVLKHDTEMILKAFGQYWVLKVAVTSFSDLMDSTGKDLFEFLKNLDAMHSRLKMTMPNLETPSFRVKKLEDDLIQLDYFSQRVGLLSFVVGILHGLSQHFGQPLEIEHVPRSRNPLPSERMLIRLT